MYSMRKQIVKLGNSSGIRFTKNEMKLYGMRIGDIIIIEDMLSEKIIKRGLKK